MGSDELATKIIISMIENDRFNPDEYPDANSYAEMICAAYKKIVKTVYNPNA